MQIRFIDFNDIWTPGTDITNHKAIERGEFTKDGLFSKEIFGNLKSNTYSCTCGELKGKFQEGKLCKECGKSVTKLKSINQIGWINLGDEYLIQPMFFSFLSKIMPIKKIIDFELHVDEDGAEEDVSKGEYDNIGLNSFKENFDEILEYYRRKLTPRKQKFYDIIVKEKDKIFTNKILVFNIALRPAMIVGESKLRFDEISIFLTSILKTLEILKTKDDGSERFRLPLLYQSQLNYNEYADTIIRNLAGKNGIIRNNLLGFRTNFSSRSTIIPMAKGGKVNEVEMPYLGFLELYKMQILNLVVSIYNVSYPVAYKKWYNAVNIFDQDIMDIMEEIVKSGANILLNRKFAIHTSDSMSKPC